MTHTIEKGQHLKGTFHLTPFQGVVSKISRGLVFVALRPDYSRDLPIINDKGTPTLIFRPGDAHLTFDNIPPTKAQQAYQLGVQAHRNGKKRIPMQDPALIDLLRGNQVGQGIGTLNGWLSGWDWSNIASNY